MLWNVIFHLGNSHDVNKKYKLLLEAVYFSLNGIINEFHFELFFPVFNCF